MQTTAIDRSAVEAMHNLCKHMLLIGAWSGREYNLAFAQGGLNALRALATGAGQTGADLHASRGGYKPSALFDGVWSKLPNGIERFTLREVQEFLVANGVQLATDSVTNLGTGSVEYFKYEVFPAIDCHDEHDAARADLDDGSGLHSSTLTPGALHLTNDMRGAA